MSNTLTLISNLHKLIYKIVLVKYMDIILKNKSDIPLKNIKYNLDIIDSVVVNDNSINIDPNYENPKIYAQINNAKKTVHCDNSLYTGKNITIAFLDTGICYIPDFQGRILYFKDFINDKRVIYDDNGHGTHVAGIASSNGIYKGLAPESNIIALKVLNSSGQGNASDVIAGIQWIANNYKKYNIRIVNMSIGTSSPIKNDPLIEAVERLWDMGIVVVTAAGNNGPNPGTISSPGTSKKIITVGSSDDEKSNKIFSGRGPTKDCIIKPDILAPGSNIISCKCTKGTYKKLSGTSMSTPIISGAIALLLEKEPNLRPDDVKYMLKLSSTQLNMPPNRQGWGLLNVEKLINMEAVYVRNQQR